MEGNKLGSSAEVKEGKEITMDVTMTTQLQNLALTLAAASPASGEQRRWSEDGEEEESDSDTSSSSSSSPSTRVLEDFDDDEGFSQPTVIRTRDEVLLEDLPAVEEVCVTLPESAELLPVGTISSIVQQLVIVQSLKDTPPLIDDSILFRSDRLAVGKVFEVFGPVSSPLYVLRFNSVDQINKKNLSEGLTLFYTPNIKEFTGYILTQQLKLLKGSDASWRNDQEPPEEALDYSDDEKEQEAKKKSKNQKRKSRADNSATVTQNALQQKPQDVSSVKFLHSAESRSEGVKE